MKVVELPLKIIQEMVITELLLPFLEIQQLIQLGIKASGYIFKMKLLLENWREYLHQEELEEGLLDFFKQKEEIPVEEVVPSHPASIYQKPSFSKIKAPSTAQLEDFSRD